MVGRRIVGRLVALGYRVRALSRNRYTDDPDIELFKGGLEDEDGLTSFLAGAQLLFHCAGELHDTARMEAVNVAGTERLVRLAERLKIQYLCHVSSAGVVGRTEDKWVDETSACNPQNPYEVSKWAAEKIVRKGVPGCRVVILRPTNIVADTQPGELEMFRQATLHSRLKLFVTGGECAHIIHADNVAAAALHFIDCSVETPACFFVSADDESHMTFAELYALYRQFADPGQSAGKAKPVHLPIFIPYLLRRVIKRSGNMGDVRYTAGKLLGTGFRFPLTIQKTLRQVFRYKP